MSVNRIAGVAYVKVDGTQIALKGKAKYQVVTAQASQGVGAIVS